jgi:O-antigen ligase
MELKQIQFNQVRSWFILPFIFLFIGLIFLSDEITLLPLLFIPFITIIDSKIIPETHRGALSLAFVLCLSSLIDNLRIISILGYVLYMVISRIPLIWNRAFALRVPALLLLIYYLVLALIRPGHIAPSAIGIHFAAFVFIVLLSLKDWNVNQLMTANTIFTLFMALSTFPEYFAGEIRSGGATSSPTTTGIILTSAWSASYTFYRQTKKSHFTLLLFSIPVFAGILFTATRALILGIFVTILANIIFNSSIRISKLNWKKITLSLFGAFLGLFIIWQVIPDSTQFKQRLNPSEIVNLKDESLMGRLVVWQASIDAINQYPVFGVGQAKFGDWMENYPLNIFGLSHAHNLIFGALSETGLWGFSMLLLILLYFFKNFFSDFKLQPYPLAVLISVINLFMFGILDIIPFYDHSAFYGIWVLFLVYFKPNYLKTNHAT